MVLRANNDFRGSMVKDSKAVMCYILSEGLFLNA